jgi:hypothetical protein
MDFMLNHLKPCIMVNYGNCGHGYRMIVVDAPILGILPQHGGRRSLAEVYEKSPLTAFKSLR